MRFQSGRSGDSQHLEPKRDDRGTPRRPDQQRMAYPNFAQQGRGDRIARNETDGRSSSPRIGSSASSQLHRRPESVASIASAFTIDSEDLEDSEDGQNDDQHLRALLVPREFVGGSGSETESLSDSDRYHMFRKPPTFLSGRSKACPAGKVPDMLRPVVCEEQVEPLSDGDCWENRGANNQSEHISLGDDMPPPEEDEDDDEGEDDEADRGKDGDLSPALDRTLPHRDLSLQAPSAFLPNDVGATQRRDDNTLLCLTKDVGNTPPPADDAALSPASIASLDPAPLEDVIGTGAKRARSDNGDSALPSSEPLAKRSIPFSPVDQYPEDASMAAMGGDDLNAPVYDPGSDDVLERLNSLRRFFETICARRDVSSAPCHAERPAEVPECKFDAEPDDVGNRADLAQSSVPVVPGNLQQGDGRHEAKGRERTEQNSRPCTYFTVKFFVIMGQSVEEICDAKSHGLRYQSEKICKTISQRTHIAK